MSVAGEKQLGNAWIAQQAGGVMADSGQYVLTMRERNRPALGQESLVAQVVELPLDPVTALGLGCTAAVHDPAVGVAVALADQVGHVACGVAAQHLAGIEMLRDEVVRCAWQAIAVTVVVGALRGR
ncbi:hypothetical protein WR25_23648 [Diploscapter pachys]|uniref:Uncharacterized protein n=1 Tax=Diploscapter pachys TaxID=2018661 RepID=A0A2A2KB29_9BILA|nr:hypothetical protein WR25_23648 [Diploscapter pachys]